MLMVRITFVGDGLELFESCLLRLGVILNKSYTTRRMFEHYSSDVSEDAKRARSLLFENMVLQAYHFIKVRKEMRRDEHFAKIDAIARPLVKLAIDHERDIVEVRNGYDVGKELQRAGFRTTVPNDVIQRMKS